MNRKYTTNGVSTILWIFLIPVFVFFCFEILVRFGDVSRIYNLLENILFSISLVGFTFILPKKLRYFFLRSAYLLLLISLFLETLYYCYFGTILSASGIFIFIETNAPEIREFISSHFDIRSTVALILLLIMLVVGWGITGKQKDLLQTKNYPKGILVIGLVLIVLFLKFSKLIIYNVPYLLVKAPLSYYQDMREFQFYGRSNPEGHFKNVKVENASPLKKLYVIVIGESTSKTHFGLYDYYRNTSPKLYEIKNELTVCNDVISPNSYTIGSLTKALTLGNTEYPDKVTSGSIIQLLNQANFETYWVSNQRPLGISETQVTKIARGAKHTIFLNTKHTDEITPFDQVLVDALDDITRAEGNNKVVFLHMIGTHIKYKNRYPEAFNYFKALPQGISVTKSNARVINQYDNAVRYDDYILRQIIENVKKQNFDSYVLYTSDHGEEVFDDSKYFGHVDGMITKSLFEIPMILWQSDSHKAKKPLPSKIYSKYVIDDLFHSIADLSFVHSDEVDSTRSLFNKAFKEKQRLINNQIEFDSIIKTQKH